MNHIQGKCSTFYNVNINGANLYNIKSCTHLEDSRTKCIIISTKTNEFLCQCSQKCTNYIIEKRENKSKNASLFNTFTYITVFY